MDSLVENSGFRVAVVHGMGGLVESSGFEAGFLFGGELGDRRWLFTEVPIWWRNVYVL